MKKKKTEKKAEKKPSKKKTIPNQWEKNNEVRVKEYRDRRLREQSAAVAFNAELKELCAKHKGDLSPSDAGDIVSNIMLAFDGRGKGNVDYEVGNYGVEAAMDTYMAKKVEEHLPRINKLYQYLVDQNHKEENSWEYTIDGYAFYIPTKGDRRIFCIGRRSANYLVFLEDGFKIDYKSLTEDPTSFKKEDTTDIHIRQIFDSVENYYDKDEFDQELKDGGLVLALKRLESLGELTDNVDGYSYVRRPDLAWYKARKYKMGYSDCRDGGYVLSLGGMVNNDRLDRCLGNYYSIKNVFFWLNCGFYAMEEKLFDTD